MFNQGSPPIECSIQTTESVIHRTWFCHAWENIEKHCAWSLIHLLRTCPVVGDNNVGISCNPCYLLRTQKFNIVATSNIFCTKTVLNRFSSYSLKPRCIIGLIHLPAHRHFHQSPICGGTWVHFCAAYNHLDEVQNFCSDCCLWFSRGLGKTIRPAVVNYFHVLVLGASLGLTAPPTLDGQFSPCWKLKSL